MKIIIPLFVVLVMVTALHPVSLFAADAQFRQRISTSDEEVTADVSEEVRFGREVAARVIARYGLYENPVLMKYVNLVGRVLSRMTNRPELEFHFAVLNADEINAYAAPGGYVFVTRGALLKMRDESELAGVLAHEMGHIVEKHAVRELGIKGTESSAVSGLAHLIGGSTESARTAFSQAVDKALDMLFKDGYKREDESQADKDAVIFCALSGYEPAGLVTYFERLKNAQGKQTEVLDKTHPSYEARIALLKETIAREGIDTGNYRTHKDRFAENIKLVK
jgi:predicted Zn-dependent protease